MRGVRRAVARSYIALMRLVKRIRNTRNANPVVNVVPTAQDLENLVVVITGSTSGIGHALAEAFLEAGARVMINGRQSDVFGKALSNLQSRFSGRVYGYQGDIAREQEAIELIDAAHVQFGRIDLLINNAAQAGYVEGPIWDAKQDLFDETLKHNTTGAFLCAQAAIKKAHSKQIPIRIINVSAKNSVRGRGLAGSYDVSKFGLEGLTHAIAVCDDEWVTALTIKPREVQTALSKSMYKRAEYELLDLPAIVTAPFLYAATAPRTEVNGRTLDEESFSSDPYGEIMLQGPLASAGPYRVTPYTYRRDLSPQPIHLPGAYLHQLETALGFCSSVPEALRQQLDSRAFYAYPDPAYPELKRAFARQLGLMPNALSLGLGITELLDRALRIFSKPGDSILIAKPCWPFFTQMIKRYQLKPFEIPQRGSIEHKNLEHDLTAMLAAVDNKTKFIYLANPCMPTGVALNLRETAAFLEQLPQHVIVLLDEAYVDYVDSDRRLELSKYLGRCQARVLGMRSLSKFHGLAGARIGYTYGHTDIISLMERATVPYNITSASVAAALAVLGDQAYRERLHTGNQSERRRVSQALDQMGIAHMPSQTNFILYHSPTDGDKMRNALLAQGLVLPESLPFLQSLALFPVGKPEHNDFLLQYLSRH